MRSIYTNRIYSRLTQLINEVASAGNIDYYDRLREFKHYCDSTPVLANCLAQLPQSSYDFDGSIRAQLPGGEGSYAMRWDAISQIVDAGSHEGVIQAERHLTGGTGEDALRRITQVFVLPIYNYLVHQLEASSTMLYILLRYKRWAEWFEAERLRRIYSDDGEDGLDRDLRRFLFESGIDYRIPNPSRQAVEPTS